MQEACKQGECIVLVSSLGVGATASIGLIYSTVVSRFVFELEGKGEVWACVCVCVCAADRQPCLPAHAGLLGWWSPCAARSRAIVATGCWEPLPAAAQQEAAGRRGGGCSIHPSCSTARGGWAGWWIRGVKAILSSLCWMPLGCVFCCMSMLVDRTHQPLRLFPQSSCISFTYWKETVSILLSPDRTSPCAIVSYIDEAYMDIDRDFSEE